MQLGARRVAPRQFGLDVHVHVLEGRSPAEFAGLDFAPDFLQAARDGLAFGAAQQADAREHGGMGQRAGDVVLPQAPVERDGLGEGRHFIRRPAGETAAS